MSEAAITSLEPRRRSAADKKRDRAVSKQAAKAAFGRMLRLVWPHRRSMGWGLVLGVGVALTYAASLAGLLPVMKVVVDEQNLHAILMARAETATGWSAWGLTWLAGIFPVADTPASRMTSLVIVLGALLAVNVIGNVCRTLSQYLVLYSAHRVVMDLRRALYRKALHIPLNQLQGDVASTVSQFLSDVREVFLGIGTFFGKFAREPFKAVAVLSVALWFDARLTLFALTVAPIAVGLLWYFGKKVRKAATRLLQGYGLMLGALEESLQGVDTVKVYGREATERRRMWTLERQMMKQQLKLAWIEAFASPLIEVIGILIACGAIVYLASQTFAGQMDSGHFITMVILLAALLDPVRKIANVYNIVQRSGAAATRIFGFLDQPEEHSPARPLRLGPAGPREIRFENVTFRYTPDAPPALEAVSLTIPPGACYAIVGPNGSGKSTLMKLLPRLIIGESGSVTVDGVDIHALSLGALRDEIAIVSQRPTIFARSARDNIRYGAPRATDEEIRGAARQAFAADFIERWPEQYDTLIGEYGMSISGGQRQRMAIARAFLKPANILIFDEATSEIDAESEQKIHAALNKLREGKTTLLIAHRHTVMDMAEKIVVMDAGQIVDVGTHAELSERCPLYQALYRSPVAH